MHKKTPPALLQEGDLSFAVPPRFAASSRTAALSGTARRYPAADNGGGVPGEPYSRRRCVSFGLRLIARIRGRSRLPCTIRQLSGGTDTGENTPFPLLFRSYGRYNIRLLCSINNGLYIVKRNHEKSYLNDKTRILGTLCGEKFTKCSLHSQTAGCIMIALYWMDYANMNDTRFRMEEVDRWYARNAARITLKT